MVGLFWIVVMDKQPVCNYPGEDATLVRSPTFVHHFRPLGIYKYKDDGSTPSYTVIPIASLKTIFK